MELSRREKQIVLGVFEELLKMEDSKINFLGSETIKEMHKLYSKLFYADYCDAHGIKYEDMTLEDFEDAYREEFEF